MGHDDIYYEGIRGRLHAALFEVAPSLSDAARQFVIEELDANELGLALEALVEEVEQQRAPVSAALVADLSALEFAMRMSIDVERRLALGAPRRHRRMCWSHRPSAAFTASGCSCAIQCPL